MVAVGCCQRGFGETEEKVGGLYWVIETGAESGYKERRTDIEDFSLEDLGILSTACMGLHHCVQMDVSHITTRSGMHGREVRDTRSTAAPP